MRAASVVADGPGGRPPWCPVSRPSATRSSEWTEVGRRVTLDGSGDGAREFSPQFASCAPILPRADVASDRDRCGAPRSRPARRRPDLRRAGVGSAGRPRRAVAARVPAALDVVVRRSRRGSRPPGSGRSPRTSAATRRARGRPTSRPTRCRTLVGGRRRVRPRARAAGAPGGPRLGRGGRLAGRGPAPRGGADLDGGVDAEPARAGRCARDVGRAARAVRVHAAVPAGGGGRAGAARRRAGRRCTAARSRPSGWPRTSRSSPQPGVLTAALNWYRAMSRADNAGVRADRGADDLRVGLRRPGVRAGGGGDERRVRRRGLPLRRRSRVRRTGCRTRRRTRWPRRSRRASWAERPAAWRRAGILRRPHRRRSGAGAARSGAGGLGQVGGAGEGGGLGAGADLELGEDVRDVDADRLLADVEPLRDLPVGARVDEQGRAPRARGR